MTAAKTNDSAILLENVSKIYCTGTEDLYALREVNLKVQKGESISILGPSGSGKSTLLHILGLLDEPSRGRVFLDGTETNHMNEAARASLRGRKIGFVFQTFNLIPTMNVLENVAIPSLIRGVPEDEAHVRAKEILRRIGMSDRLLHLQASLVEGKDSVPQSPARL